MDQNTFFTLINAIAGTLGISMFYPVFKAKCMEDLNEALKTRPMLAKAVARKASRSYIRSSIFFIISLVVYGAIAVGSDVEVDMALATESLLILFGITLARVWKLCKLLGNPAGHAATD